MILTTIAIPSLFHEAYEWLWRARKKHPANADVWDFRGHWKRGVQSLIADFRTGDYRFDVQKNITLASGETFALWSARDALVIK